MRINIGEVEFTPSGESRSGKEKLDGTVELADGSKAFIKLYRPAQTRAAAATAPSIRKSKVVHGSAPQAPSFDPSALTPEMLAKLQKALAALSAPAPVAKEEPKKA